MVNIQLLLPASVSEHLPGWVLVLVVVIVPQENVQVGLPVVCQCHLDVQPAIGVVMRCTIDWLLTPVNRAPLQRLGFCDVLERNVGPAEPTPVNEVWQNLQLPNLPFPPLVLPLSTYHLHRPRKLTNNTLASHSNHEAQLTDATDQPLQANRQSHLVPK